jgi:hypothetical protein
MEEQQQSGECPLFACVASKTAMALTAARSRADNHSRAALPTLAALRAAPAPRAHGACAQAARARMRGGARRTRALLCAVIAVIAGGAPAHGARSGARWAHSRAAGAAPDDVASTAGAARHARALEDAASAPPVSAAAGAGGEPSASRAAVGQMLGVVMRAAGVPAEVVTVLVFDKLQSVVVTKARACGALAARPRRRARRIFADRRMLPARSFVRSRAHRRSSR